MKSVYIETTIPSLAVSRPSRDVIISGRQAATLLFWETERHQYDLFVSQYVIDECSLGDREAAGRRLAFLKEIPVIPKSERVSELAGQYQQLLNIPDRSIIDCFHLAVCVVAEIDYLLSWNCTHLGIHTYVKIQKYNQLEGLFTPLLLTPEALMEIY
ncbi:MAG: type II toxin-antitoxin system VapC family toxin [Planctomycetaceae bacterium]|nr:type II toxin-antitoxin system VapC family toxin [Planctomycetaceae bacterium]